MTEKNEGRESRQIGETHGNEKRHAGKDSGLRKRGAVKLIREIKRVN
jgi:hypothetical protein